MPDLERWPASHLLSRAAKMLERLSAQALEPLGLTHAEAVALRILAGTGPCTQTELAEACGMRAQSLGVTLMKLQSRSCVHLRRSGRTQLITMTQHGEQILERVISAEREALFGVLLEGRFREDLEVLVRTLSEHDAAEH